MQTFEDLLPFKIILATTLLNSNKNHKSNLTNSTLHHFRVTNRTLELSKTVKSSSMSSQEGSHQKEIISTQVESVHIVIQARLRRRKICSAMIIPSTFKLNTHKALMKEEVKTLDKTVEDHLRLKNLVWQDQIIAGTNRINSADRKNI